MRSSLSLSLLFFAVESYGFPNYAILYKSTYTYLPACVACHEGDSWAPNDFGKQFLKHGRNLKAFQSIADKDADGDGIANFLEIKAKANPSDPRSTPQRPGDWLDHAQIRAPKKLLANAFPSATKYEIKESLLDTQTANALAKRFGGPLPDESRYTVVFPAFEGDTLLGAGTYVSADIPGTKSPSLFFIAGSSSGTLTDIKVIEYEGSSKLKKDSAWWMLDGKDSEDIRAAKVPGPAGEVDTVKNAVRRALLSIEAALR